ncbi:hypothetical protein Tco_0134864 [Tanacetum coccineum]
MSNHSSIYNLLKHHNLTLDTPKLMKYLTLSPNKLHSLPNHSEQLSLRQTTNFEPRLTPEIKQQFRMVGSWFRTFKGDRIIIKGTLFREMVQQAMGEHRIELGMQMHVKKNRSSVIIDKMLLTQAQENGAVLDEEELLFLVGEQTNTFDADVDNQPVRDLTLNEDNIFQADECDAFDSDVDDEPTAQSIFMANLSSAGPANLKAGPSNASILSGITVIDSTSADMGNSNVIPYEQYLTINDVFVVPSSASSVPNDAYVLHDNDAYFELTLREQKWNELMSYFIGHNKKEDNLRKELHSVKLQLNSTIQNNKIIEETVTALKQEFKQKETKFLTDFSNMKNLKDKLENKLYSQDQSIQTVHMMLKHTKLYDQDAETAIGFTSEKAKKAQPALYDSDELLKGASCPYNYYII